MSAPRILAVDLALTKTGIACHAPDYAGFQPAVWTFDTERQTNPVTGRLKKLVGYERDQAIVREIVRALDMVKPTVCLLEDLYVPPKVSEGWRLLAYLHGVVRYLLRGRAPLVVIENSHPKIFATGNGGSGKPAMILAIERWYHHLVQIEDDNQADAWSMLAMGCARYGHPLSTVNNRTLPKTHLRALDLVKDWPVLNGAPESPAGLTATTLRRARLGREATA